MEGKHSEKRFMWVFFGVMQFFQMVKKAKKIKMHFGSQVDSSKDIGHDFFFRIKKSSAKKPNSFSEIVVTSSVFLENKNLLLNPIQSPSTLCSFFNGTMTCISLILLSLDTNFRTLAFDRFERLIVTRIVYYSKKSRILVWWSFHDIREVRAFYLNARPLQICFTEIP